MKKYLEFKNREDHKFWQIEVSGEVVTTTQGNVGAKKAPKPKSKSMKSPESALASAEKAIAKKKAAYFFDPTSIEGILESHLEYLAVPTEKDVEEHRAELPYACDDYFDVYRTGALSIGDFNDFGRFYEEMKDDELSELTGAYIASSAEDLIDESGAALDPYFYIFGSLYDGSAVIQYNQGVHAGRIGVIDHGPSYEMKDHIVEGDADATIAAWLEESLIEPPSDLTLSEYLRLRLLHHKGAAVAELQELREALAALEEAISGDPAELVELDLSGKGLRMLPDFLGQCTNLEIVSLRENDFETVPEVIRNFEKLQVLDLYFTSVDSSDLPMWLADLPIHTLNLGITSPRGSLATVIPLMDKLEVLHLPDVGGLPASIGQASSLVVLCASLRGGAIEAGGVGKLTALQELRPGTITSLPDDIGNLSSLKILSFNVNANAVFTLPDSIRNLKALEVLGVGSATLPPAIGDLKSLTYLEASGNAETGLPEEMSSLSNLVELNLHYAKTPSLPESFGDLQKLETLNLESSYIERLPDSFAELKSLRHLNLATAGQARIVVGDRLCSLENLEFLALNWSVLNSLEGSFSGLEKLETVKVYSGTLKEGDFIELMGFVHELPNLKTLGVPYEFKQHFAEALPEVTIT